ncbi:MAG: hypothetical protein WCJ58_08970 [bacterium]
MILTNGVLDMLCQVFDTSKSELNRLFSESDYQKNHQNSFLIENQNSDLTLKTICNNQTNDITSSSCEQTLKISPTELQRIFTNPLILAMSDTRRILASSVALVPGVLTVSTLVFAYPNIIFYGFLWVKWAKKRAIWGLIYDQETKLPIPFANIKIILSQQKVLQVISDLDGRYGFVVDAGSYLMTIEHALYHKISKNIQFSSEEHYAEDFAMIKLDLEQNRLLILKNWLTRNIKIINYLMLFIGFSYTLIISFFTPNIINFVILALYFLQFIIFIYIWIVNHRRQWGVVMDSQTELSVPGIFVRIFSEAEKRQLDVKLTDASGRYQFTLDQGTYQILVEGPNYQFDVSKLDPQDLYRSPAGVNFLNYEQMKKGMITEEIFVKKQL